MKQFLFFLFPVIFSPVFIHAQGILVFHKKKNPKRTYSIALNQYPVFVKPINGKRMLAIISSEKDSTLTIRVQSKDKSLNAKMRQVNYDPTLDRDQHRKKTDSLLFSNVQQIKFGDIKHIAVYRSMIPHKTWIPATEFIGGIAALVLFTDYENALKPNSVHVIWPAVIVGYAAAIIFVNRKIISSKKWSL